MALAEAEAPVKGPPRRASDLLFDRLLGTSAVLVLLVAGALVLVLASSAGPSVAAFGPAFVVGREWNPVRDSFGALPFIAGTLASSAIGLLLAVPVGVGAAVFVAELAPPWSKGVLALLLDLLAAVPSVIYGLWGIFVLQPLVRGTLEPAIAGLLGGLPLVGSLFAPRGIGPSLFTAGLILAVIVVPYISSVSREALAQVDGSYREAALALGATRWEAIRVAVIPAARSGLVAAVFLGLGRALGETMAVTMVIGNRSDVPRSVFDPAHTIASALANEFAEAHGDLHLSALAELALILFAVTLVVNVIARALVRKLAPAAAGRGA